MAPAKTLSFYGKEAGDRKLRVPTINLPLVDRFILKARRTSS
jgi:hypothetical protein